MTPFQVFRLWWRRASPGSRAATVAATVVVVALLIWIAVPSGTNGSSVLAFGSGTAGSSGTGASQPAAGQAPIRGANSATQVTSGAGQTAPGATGSSPNGSSFTPSSPSGSSPIGSNPAGSSPPGVVGTSGTSGASGPASGPTGAVTCTGKQASLPVGVVLISIGGVLNATFNVPSPSAQQAEWAAAIASVNKAGGVGCHPIAPDFQTFNELDPSTAEAACLEFAQHKDFALLGGFLPGATDDCTLQHRIPVVEEIPISGTDAHNYYPYYFSVAGQFQVIYRNFVDAARQMGVFSASGGFKKLGIFYRDCQPDVNAALLGDLSQIGVGSSQIVRYDLGCPSNFAAPTADEQGVLQMKAAGVTTATFDNDIADVQNITKAAQAQGFRPRWAVGDAGLVAVTGTATFAPDPNNFNGAMAITPYQYGGQGLPESAATKRCDQVMTAAGLPPVMQSPDQFAGLTCNIVWLLQAAASHDPTFSQAGLVTGLQQVGSVDFAFPDGPDNFSAPGTTWGGQEWRAITFHASCTCWMPIDPAFHASFS